MIDTYAAHESVLVYFEPERITTPAEVCGTCSDEYTGRWIPVTSCPRAAANQLPDGALNPNVMTLTKACPQCGSREDLEKWHDEQGSGWQCHNLTCEYFAVEGEDE